METRSFIFRVAKNMLQTATNRPEHELASAKRLLENCVKLLDAKTHPELVTSAYYLLSELYLFGTIDNSSGAADNCNESVQGEDTMVNAVSNTDTTAEPNVGILSYSMYHLECEDIVFHLLLVMFLGYINRLDNQ